MRDREHGGTGAPDPPSAFVRAWWAGPYPGKVAGRTLATGDEVVVPRAQAEASAHLQIIGPA